MWAIYQGVDVYRQGKPKMLGGLREKMLTKSLELIILHCHRPAGGGHRRRAEAVTPRKGEGAWQRRRRHSAATRSTSRGAPTAWRPSLATSR